MEGKPESRTSSPLSPAEQARIRREIRQAKMKAGGTSRLNKITGMQGQSFRSESDAPPAPQKETTPPQETTAPMQESTPDPPDVDISEHHYEPKSRQQQRMAMQGFNSGMWPSRTSQSVGGEWDSLFLGGDQPNIDLIQSMGNPVFGSAGGTGGGQEDLVFQMMQKLMGDGGFGGGPGIPLPEVKKMKQKEESWGRWWKLLHFLSAVLLSLWVVRCAGWTFKGSLLERVESTNLARSEKPQLLWYFATMELVLQSSRFFLEKGRPPPGSWLTTIGSFLPPPIGTFLTTIARYSVIWTTLIADAGVIIFCLGVYAFWCF